MFDITNFSIRDLTECRSAFRTITEGAKSMEEAAERIVRYLYNNFSDNTGKKSCALIRFYKTHNFEELDNELQRFAINFLGNKPKEPKMKCLTLMATAGEKPEWNSRQHSSGHKAIPLPSEKVVENLPMVSQLVKQFGLEISDILRPSPTLLIDMAEKTYNVFHIYDALSSQYVPAQKDFVIPYKIRSVIGFGGILPWGDLYAIIIFFKVYVPKEVAEMFKTLAIGTKTTILPFMNRQIFS
jgi:hypothetical protein